MAFFDSYVICTSPRSGSTLLCNLLARTGVAGHPDSHFHEPSIEAWLGYYDLTLPEGLAQRDVLALIFEAAMKEGSGDTGRFGVRLQRHSFDFFTRQLAVLYPEPASDAARIEAAFGRTLFIHLTRRDKVEQAVSYVKARQSGLWHRAPDGTEIERLAPPKDPVYDTDAIRAQYDEMTASDRDWETWFAAQRIEPVRLVYETVSRDPVGALRRVLEALGRDVSAADGIEPGVAKLADAVSREWVARFRAELGAA